MALNFNYSGHWDSESKRAVEDAVRRWVGEPPERETWRVTLVAGLFPTYCEVRVATPNQCRTRVFFDELAKLPDAIVDWISRYPLR